MNTKCNIGDEVYIKAKVSSMHINEQGEITYYLKSHLFADIVGAKDNDLVFGENVERKPEPQPKKANRKIKKPSEKAIYIDKAIKKTKLSKNEFTNRLNKWLAHEQTCGKYDGIAKFYSCNISSFINGNRQLSSDKVRAIEDFIEDLELYTGGH